jgi:hypothetical protein
MQRKVVKEVNGNYGSQWFLQKVNGFNIGNWLPSNVNGFYGKTMVAIESQLFLWQVTEC